MLQLTVLVEQEVKREVHSTRDVSAAPGVLRRARGPEAPAVELRPRSHVEDEPVGSADQLCNVRLRGDDRRVLGHDREIGYRQLMRALSGTGNTAEALRIYEQLRTLLRDELGVAPSGETLRLHDELLRGISRTGA
ncbi:MAG TPA: BTAD domain-containing putative transcriptional regulator [Solirubrobacteraceae bacterium]|nr:BTAD domain-containing putative transcriptional regulator [Solirubrobacteraceae bacterium]